MLLTLASSSGVAALTTAAVAPAAAAVRATVRRLGGGGMGLLLTVAFRAVTFAVGRTLCLGVVVGGLRRDPTEEWPLLGDDFFVFADVFAGCRAGLRAPALRPTLFILL